MKHFSTSVDLGHGTVTLARYATASTTLVAAKLWRVLVPKGESQIENAIQTTYTRKATKGQKPLFFIVKCV